MADGEMDDAWLQAELDRELEAMGDIGDDASDSDGEAEGDASNLPGRQSDQKGVPETLAEEAPTTLPASFLELMQGLQDWETSMAVSTEKEIQNLEEDAQMAERHLHEPLKAGDLAETFDEEEKEIFSAEIVGSKCAEAWWRFAVRLSATTSKDEANASTGDTPEGGILSSGLPPAADLGSPLGKAPRIVPSTAATAETTVADLSVTGPEASPAQPLETCYTESVAMDPDEQLLRRVEEEQKRIAAENAALLAELEAKRTARLLAMEQEEEARRREEERLREERAMYSEELRLREFIEFRRSCRRREQRCMAWEDRRGSQVRLEEFKEKERILQQKEAEEAERRRQEEKLAERKRKLEEEAERKRLEQQARKRREAEEKRRLEEEDEKRRQQELAEKRRQEEEAEKRRKEEEAEKRRLEEEAERKMQQEELERKQQDEVRRMAIEDGLSALLQQPLEVLASAKLGSRAAGTSWQRNSAVAAVQHVAAFAVHCASKPSEALAALALPPPISQSAASASDEVIQKEPHAVKATIDPWAHTMQPMVSHGAQPSSSTCSAGHVGVSVHMGNACQLCCQALLKAIDAWQKTPQTWKRPAAASVDGIDELLLKKVNGALTSSALQSSKMLPKDSGPPLELDLDMLGLDPGSGKEIVRLEIKQEGLQRFPNLAFAPRLRILDLTGNQLKNLEPLAECTLLEEVVLCQNFLTSLKGLQQLKRLVVLKATANEIADATELSMLPSLRVVALSVNHLRMVHWQISSLTKLELYGNALVSSAFLEYLPSLTYLDLGRNRLTSISSRISEWNPLLVKLHLYENMIASLAELQLPLLTDLVLNKNALETLGPLGFLPSLERLEAKYNNIQFLSCPISASPLLHTLALTDNQLGSAEAVCAVFEYPRLRNLHLNCNPFACEPVMDPARYRSWVLERAPQLQELDNEPFSEAEKRSAVLRHALDDPYLPHQLSSADICTKAVPAASSKRRRHSAAGDHGLLGLAELAPADAEEEGARAAPGTSDVGCRLTAAEIIRVRRQDMLGRWQHACLQGAAGGDAAGGCQACGLALWCDSLIWARVAPLSAHMRDERLFASRVEKSSKDLREEEFLHTLRRRREFWDSFMDICAGHYEDLRDWRCGSSLVCRTGAFEIRGAERSRQRLISRVQACWRSKLARRRCTMLQLERRCHQLSEEHLQAVVRVQAVCRGVLARQGLRAAGVQLPRDRIAAGEHAARQQAAVRLQAVIRGTRARRKLQKATQWAREMSKFTEDEIGDLPEFDVNQFLADVKTFDPANPFEELRVPDPVPRQPTREKQSSIEATLSSALVANSGSAALNRPSGSPNRTPAAPMEAWCTPPATATMLPAASPTASPAAPHVAAGSYDDSSAGSPMSGRGGFQVRRSRSMSSTAESAITECEGLARPSREQHVQEDWNLQDPRTAQSILASQRRRQRPPGLPKVSQNHSGSSFGPAPVRSNASRRGGPLARGGGASLLGRGAGRGSGSSAAQGSGGAPKKVLKAQDCIADFFKQRQEEEARQMQSPAGEAMEFQSGAPNQKLLRMQSPNSSFSPRSRERAGSPLRMSGSL